MDKVITFFNKLNVTSQAIAKALAAMVIVLCLVSLVIPSIDLKVLKTVISTLRSIGAAVAQVGVDRLIALAILVVLVKK